MNIHLEEKCAFNLTFLTIGLKCTNNTTLFVFKITQTNVVLTFKKKKNVNMFFTCKNSLLDLNELKASEHKDFPRSRHLTFH